MAVVWLPVRNDWKKAAWVPLAREAEQTRGLTPRRVRVPLSSFVPAHRRHFQLGRRRRAPPGSRVFLLSKLPSFPLTLLAGVVSVHGGSSRRRRLAVIHGIVFWYYFYPPSDLVWILPCPAMWLRHWFLFAFESCFFDVYVSNAIGVICSIQYFEHSSSCILSFLLIFSCTFWLQLRNYTTCHPVALFVVDTPVRLRWRYSLHLNNLFQLLA